MRSAVKIVSKTENNVNVDENEDEDKDEDEFWPGRVANLRHVRPRSHCQSNIRKCFV